jgi:hypothetical protein
MAMFPLRFGPRLPGKTGKGKQLRLTGGRGADSMLTSNFSWEARMKGWQIFIHSVRQVFGNLTAALQVSALLYLAQTAAQILLVGDILALTDLERQQMMMSGQFPAGRFLLFTIIALIAGLWIAVGWHRYVLLDEKPGYLPPFHGDRMLGYFGKGLLIALIMVIPIFVLTFLLGSVGAMLMMNGQLVSYFIVSAILFLPLLILATRLSTMLPGVALHSGVPIMQGWNATIGETGAILGLTIVSAVMVLGLGVIGQFLFGGSGFLTFIWQTVINWPLQMIGISIMTTLYGHYIEKRPLV